MAARKGLGALVFGGGSGLGLATAQRLVRNGYKVVVADLPSSEGDRVARDLGDSCIFASADVSAIIGPFLSLPLHPSPNPPRIDETSGCVGIFDRWNISEGNEEKNPFFRKNGTFFSSSFEEVTKSKLHYPSAFCCEKWGGAWEGF